MADKPYKPTKKEMERIAFIESLPISVRYPIQRKRCLERCLRWRFLIRNPEKIAGGNIDDARLGLARDQKLLLKLRIWRTTGAYPRDN
jgi:hypothetical protein